MQMRMGLGISRAVGVPFTPLSLFSGGTVGVWYDPSDLSTLFSDAAGTTPASVDGPVRLMRDKSGNGIDATAPSDAARPVLRQSGSLYYLEFDGTDDVLAFNGSFVVNSSYSVLLGFAAPNSPGSSSVFCIGGTTALNNQNLHMGFNQTINARLAHFGNDLTGAFAWVSTPVVMTGRMNLSVTRDLRAQGAQVVSGAAPALTSYSGAGFGRLNTGFHRVNLYGAVLMAKYLNAADTTTAEQWLSAKCGVTF